MTTTLYRFYDTDDRLLYVGIAGNPGRRFHEHAQTKKWWPQVSHSTMEHFPDRAAALDAEREAIKVEHPIHNVVHNKIPAHWDSVTLICDGCQQPIEAGSGYLQVDQRQARKAVSAEAKIESPPGSGWKPYNLTELFALADMQATWECWHRACDPDPDGPQYWIGSERLSTWQQVLWFIAHVGGKGWAPGTNWDDLLLSLANGTGPIRLTRQAAEATP